MQAPQLLRQLVARQVGRRAHSSGGHHVTTTYNDLPTPQGNWKTHYDAKQRAYTAHLILGTSVLVGTIVFGKAAGLLDFYNDYPERPLDIPSYK